MKVPFDCEGEVVALRKEFAEREIIISKLQNKVNTHSTEIADNRDRMVKITAILYSIQDATEEHNKVVRRQIRKLFHIASAKGKV